MLAHSIPRFLLFYLLLIPCKSLHTDTGLQLVRAPAFERSESLRSIKFVSEDEWYFGQNVIYDNEAIWLNPDPREAQTRAASNIGKIIYRDKVRFKYADHGMISFESSFTFQIITTNPYPSCGSGMVFFIADFYKAPERSYGRYFGLVSPNRTDSYRFFAVEFDTHVSEQFADPSASHIGIDINSLKSLQYVDSQPNSSSPFFPQLYLYNNSTFTALIKYDASAALIEVWISSSNSSLAPSSPCLRLRYNLSDVFQEYMYVGFSATSNASDDSMEGHALFAWNLTVYPPDSSNGRPHKLFVPLTAAFSGAVLLFICSFLAYLISGTVKRRHHRQCLQITGSNRAFFAQVIHHATIKEYSYEELMVASQNFSRENEIGQGTFSVVYKATLENGETVAIKRLKDGSRKELEFSAEMRVISHLRHKNLLALRGWCYEKREALLIYGYMRRGSLNRYLYGPDRGTLSSNVRLDIVGGVASALEYLHEHAGSCVLHRDVKAANVLLTEDWKPVLADFGLARLICRGENSVAMTAAGSPGYIAPEVVFSNKVTDKADVYSFGVLSLVVASGRPAMLESTTLDYEEMRLVDWVGLLQQQNQLIEALDPAMAEGLSDLGMRHWMRVLHMSLACVQPSPQLRPSMSKVCRALLREDGASMHRNSANFRIDQL